MKKTVQITTGQLQQIIKEGVARLHRQTLIENRIKQINEELENISSMPQDNFEGKLNFYIDKALSVEPTEEYDGGSRDYDYKGTYVFHVFNDVEGEEFLDYYLVLEYSGGVEGDEDGLSGYENFTMYFSEESAFSEDENSEIDKYMSQYMEPIEWGSRSWDNLKLSAENEKYLKNSFISLKESTVDDGDSGNMSDSEFHRWANPGLGR